MIKYIALIILIYAGVANAQTFQVVTKVAYENERITAYNSLNKVIYQVDCKDFAYQFNSDGSIKIWDDIHAYTLYANTLTVPTFASVVDSLKLWQKRCSIPALNMPSNMDSTHMDTSMVVPFILENIYYNQNKDTSNIYKLNEIYDIIGVINSRGLDSSQVDTSLILPTLISNFSVNNNDTLSAILQTIKTIDVADTSNLWMINEVYNQLGLINARAYDTSQVDTSMIEPFIIESFSIRNNDTLSAILLALNNLTPNDTSNFWIFDSIYQELKAVDTLCFTGEIAVSDSLLRTTVVDCGGTNAIAVKMCEGDTTNQFILKDIYKKIDTTNTILNNLYFVGCGESIPIGFIGYKFENAVDLSCSGGLPSTTEVCDFQHCLSSTPPSCIPMANQAAMQNFINSTLIPDLNACYGTSLVANDIIYIYNSALDEVEVWYNPALLTAANPPHNFVIAPIGTGASCEKPFPSIPIATSALSGGDALLVKVCEPLNVVTDTTINATIREMRDSIITLLKDTIDFEYNTICYRSKADSGVYQFSVVFDVKTPNIPYYMSFFDVDSLTLLYSLVNGVSVGTIPNFATDYVPCERWNEYLSSTKQDTLKTLVFKAQTKRIDGTLDTLYNCKGLSFSVSENATGNIILYYGDGDQDVFDVANESLPFWENGSFVEFLGFDASGIAGVLRVNMLGCSQTPDVVCAKEKPIVNCTSSTPIIICSGWASASGIWSTLSGCWNTGQ